MASGGGNKNYGKKFNFSSNKNQSQPTFEPPAEYADQGEPANLVECGKCGRKFGEERIDKHEKACKANAKPKKVKLFHKPAPAKEKQARNSSVGAKPQSNWRAQHEALVQQMKYNRMLKKAEEEGVPLHTLPPPPKNPNDPG